jgi:hypothetical protein
MLACSTQQQRFARRMVQMRLVLANPLCGPLEPWVDGGGACWSPQIAPYLHGCPRHCLPSCLMVEIPCGGAAHGGQHLETTRISLHCLPHKGPKPHTAGWTSSMPTDRQSSCWEVRSFEHSCIRKLTYPIVPTSGVGWAPAGGGGCCAQPAGGLPGAWGRWWGP